MNREARKDKYNLVYDRMQDLYTLLSNIESDCHSLGLHDIADKADKASRIVAKAEDMLCDNQSQEGLLD